MPKGISLHVGLNRVDGNQYGGWNGELNACEADAQDMAALAKKARFSTQTLLTAEATAEAVTERMTEAAQALAPGDIFFLSYSGHGGQVPDTNGDEAEDQKDETWVLYDRELIDDEIYALLGQFQTGVRVLVLSDSCHSGSVLRLTPMYRGLHQVTGTPAPSGYRGMPEDVAVRTYEGRKQMYDDIQKAHPAGERVSVGASALLISGCQDNQLSSDGRDNGLFTGTLKKVWKGGKFSGGYLSFYKAILKNMPLYQTPNLFKAGTRSLMFERQKPFTI
jgi:metacaspase-1